MTERGRQEWATLDVTEGRNCAHVSCNLNTNNNTTTARDKSIICMGDISVIMALTDTVITVVTVMTIMTVMIVAAVAVAVDAGCCLMLPTLGCNWLLQLATAGRAHVQTPYDFAELRTTTAQLRKF